MGGKKTDFKSRQVVERWLQTAKSFGKVDAYKDLLDGVVYSFRERIGTARDLPSDYVSNRAFWEVHFPAAMDQIVDTVTFHQALRITIARRLVTVLLSVFNAGSAPAKAIKVTLQRPYLVKPRSIMTSAEVEYIEIESEQPICQISNAKSHAIISIPFLKKEELYSFYVTTSMTNVTKENVIIDYTSHRFIDGYRIMKLSLIIIVLYYFLPISWTLIRKIKFRKT